MSQIGGMNISSPQFASTGTLTPQQQQLATQLQGQQQAGPVGINPAQTAQYINQSVATPLLRQFDQSIMPRLNDSYASVGALMGSRRGFAGQQALQSLQSTIGQQLGQAQLSNQQLNANLSLGYLNAGNQMTGQSRMAIQPYQNIQSGNNLSGAANSLMGMGANLPGPQTMGSQANAMSQLPTNPFNQPTSDGVQSFSSDYPSGSGGAGLSYSDMINQLLSGGSLDSSQMGADPNVLTGGQISYDPGSVDASSFGF